MSHHHQQFQHQITIFIAYYTLQPSYIAITTMIIIMFIFIVLWVPCNLFALSTFALIMLQACTIELGTRKQSRKTSRSCLFGEILSGSGIGFVFWVQLECTFNSKDNQLIIFQVFFWLLFHLSSNFRSLQLFFSLWFSIIQQLVILFLSRLVLFLSLSLNFYTFLSFHFLLFLLFLLVKMQDNKVSSKESKLSHCPNLTCFYISHRTLGAWCYTFLSPSLLLLYVFIFKF